MTKEPANDSVNRLTVGSMLRTLRNTALVMDKAERHAAANGIALDAYLQARLYPDMFNLLQQIQYVCYLAADFARHFTDVTPPRVGYDEETWPQLRNSLDLAAGYLAGITPEQLSRHARKTVPLFNDDKKTMAAVDYAATMIVPDIHFHAVIAYALLRHNGVPLGKSDFFGELPTVVLSGPA